MQENVNLNMKWNVLVKIGTTVDLRRGFILGKIWAKSNTLEITAATSQFWVQFGAQGFPRFVNTGSSASYSKAEGLMLIREP